MTDPRQWRVSDAEREHVVGVLQKAIGRGLITLDEFTERTDAALAARTREELNPVLLDLPGLVHGDRDTAVPGQEGTTVQLRANMSTVSRKGGWVVPRTVVVQNRMGTTDLDFRDATVPHPVVDVELDVTCGTVRLVVPDGMTVNTDGVHVSMGSIKDKVGDGSGRPHLVLRGTVTLGSLEIKRKKSWLRSA
ncbi:DUF1707 SHOCT-like domain-containing protein [Saccharothrix algeriensis]|uniref:DUF1707 domain-containing protein n=1 Tax=Saccharothrix algeriensis TaxID=173560 RepID=A0A8T8I519_9PSEU|nr:DUF1707 domain-containing protein [Saccharothrix algeriensis]MBM7812230.1 hypothetical protein [Saccharothrix algeriensis]QTR05849.1 DUF1707 domain-containing protein [Saccharothrix algeriensis]